MKILKKISAVLLLLVAPTILFAQSSEQEFPTPLTTNELMAVIEPKSIGDARLTTYYYNFDGTQGDIFVNIVTKNLNGDIDIFVRDGLRLLTKVIVYADVGDGETGRVIYLRKPEKLLLRVRGRSPNDDPASIQIKFAGSFVAAAATDVPDAPRVARRTVEETRSVAKKVTPADKPDQVAVKTDASERNTKTKDQTPRSPTPTKTATVKRTATKDAEKPSEIPQVAKVPAPASRQRTAPGTRPSVRETRATSPAGEARTTQQTEAAKQVEAAPEQKLVVEFIDGSKLERSMNDVLRFTVDRGVLTIIDKNGRIGRYQMSTVKKLSIE